MQKEELLREIEAIIGNYIRGRGMELVDFTYRYEGRDVVLRILADWPQSGITIDECGRLNQEISRILDEAQILQDSYILEVCSPGLDRPLRTKSDFLRCLNRRVVFFLAETINNKIELEGQILTVSEDAVFVDINGERAEIPLTKIAKAKQVISNV